jgi:hypothetical protein
MALGTAVDFGLDQPAQLTCRSPEGPFTRQPSPHLPHPLAIPGIPFDPQHFIDRFPTSAIFIPVDTPLVSYPPRTAQDASLFCTHIPPFFGYFFAQLSIQSCDPGHQYLALGLPYDPVCSILQMRCWSLPVDDDFLIKRFYGYAYGNSLRNVPFESSFLC